jgi:hypothetical protein
MRIPKSEIPVKIEVPGATARQMTDFGDASPCGMIGAEYFSMAAGTDLAPLLQGLENDMCPSPHWGYLIEGEVTVTYENGSDEQVHGGDVFYWPPYHSVKVSQDAELILFSPQHEHSPVIEHVHRMVSG